MRVVNYQNDVIYGIARLLGIDPTTVALTPERAAQWNEFINTRANEAWKFWDWPELRVTQERAFRIIWNSTKQFKRASTQDQNRLGQPDQLFYIPTFSYYQVLATAPGDPTPGTLPTNTTYFTPLTTFDQYLDLDEPSRQAIGDVLGVYNNDPRTAGGAGAIGLNFRISERGVECAPTNMAGASVFITFKIRRSKFTSVPWASGTTYNKGDYAFYTDGNCYRSLQGSNTNQSPATQTAYWALVPFPERVAEFVKRAAAADAADDQQTQAKLLSEARDFLCSEADALVAQGNISFYSATDRRRRIWIPLGTSGFWWSISAPWTGGTGAVTTLTDTDQFDLY